MLNLSMRGEAAPSELLGVFSDLGRELIDLAKRKDVVKFYKQELEGVKQHTEALEKVQKGEVPLLAFPGMDQEAVAEEAAFSEKRFLDFIPEYLDAIGKLPQSDRKYLHWATLRPIYEAAYQKFHFDELEKGNLHSREKLNEEFLKQLRGKSSVLGEIMNKGEVEKTREDIYTKEDAEKDFQLYRDMYLSEVGKKSPAEQKFLSVPMMRSFYDKAYKNFVSDLLAELGEKKSTKYPNESEMHKMFLEQVRVGPEMAKGLRGAERLSTEALEEEPEDLTAFAEEVPAKKSPPKFKGPKPSIQQAA